MFRIPPLVKPLLPNSLSFLAENLLLFPLRSCYYQAHVQWSTLHTTAMLKTHTSSTKRKTVHLTLWVKPELKAEIQRLAAQERLSASKVGAALLEEAIRQQLHIQHAVLLQPIIERMAALSTRLSSLLVRGVFLLMQ